MIAILGTAVMALAMAPQTAYSSHDAHASTASSPSRPSVRASGNGAVSEERSERRPARAVKSKVIGIIVYDDFETLDVFGPVQMWGRLPDHRLVLVSEDGRPVRSSQGVVTSADYSFRNSPRLDVVMVPGGMGARKQVKNTALLSFLRMQDRETEWTTSVCTGAAILAKAGLLDGRSATTNKLAFAWATSQSARVRWQTKARWVTDGKYVTSSGVSAGTDMALAVVERLYDPETARETAKIAEYVWNEDALNDPFALPSPDASSR